ncbi:MAG: hypothetical protein J4F45_04675, partial [Pseudomonadales bacterium]|nr:hypothetical protein [Pseudomonadales bacterium]
AERVESAYEIVSRAVTGTDITLRGVTANGMPDGANPVETATLEEAYLAFMAARGRSDAARQDDETPPADGPA